MTTTSISFNTATSADHFKTASKMHVAEGVSRRAALGKKAKGHTSPAAKDDLDVNQIKTLSRVNTQ